MSIEEPQLISLHTLRLEIRAANSELELRLRDYMERSIQPVSDAQESFTRGEFTKAQTAALNDVVDARLDKRARIGLTARQWRLAVVGVVVAFSSMAISAIFLIKSLLQVHHG